MLSYFFLWILNVFVSLILCVIEDVHVCLTVWMLFVCFLCTFHLNITIKYLMLSLLLLNHTRCLMATCQAYWYGSLVFTSYGSDTVYLPMTVEVWPWSLHSSWVTFIIKLLENPFTAWESYGSNNKICTNSHTGTNQSLWWLNQAHCTQAQQKWHNNGIGRAF